MKLANNSPEPIPIGIFGFSRLLFWPVFVATMMLTLRLYAPFIPPPVLAISHLKSNTVTITVISGSSYNYALQMSTNLTTPSWINIQTNYSVVPPIIFTNLPATNSCEFFRMVTPP
jgi:hypothetical protein